MKIFDACKAAFINFQASLHFLYYSQMTMILMIQVSLDPIGTDKFSKLLQICHKCLATLFEVSFVGCGYLMYDKNN